MSLSSTWSTKILVLDESNDTKWQPSSISVRRKINEYKNLLCIKNINPNSIFAALTAEMTWHFFCFLLSDRLLRGKKFPMAFHFHAKQKMSITCFSFLFALKFVTENGSNGIENWMQNWHVSCDYQIFRFNRMAIAIKNLTLMCQVWASMLRNGFSCEWQSRPVLYAILFLFDCCTAATMWTKPLESYFIRSELQAFSL